MNVSGDAPEPLSQPPGVRASDADRERVAQALQQHFADGRLTYDELQERLQQSYSARTVGELDRPLADLPAIPPPPPPRPVRTTGYWVRSLPNDIVRYIVICLICVAIWAASGAHGSFWPIWVIVGLGAATALRYSRRIGR